MLTPFQQGRRYGGFLPNPEQPRWIVVCNFQTFEIHDMNRPNDEPEVLLLQYILWWSCRHCSRLLLVFQIRWFPWAVQHHRRYLDDFYSGDSDELKTNAIFQEMRNYMEKAVRLNVTLVFT